MQRSLLPVAIALATTAGLIVVRGVTVRLCRGWAEKTENQIVAILVDSFRTPSLFWCLAIGIYAGVAVSDITWRTTRIRMISNNMVVIPNSKITQSILTNYFLPEKRMAIQIPVRVSESSDPEKVERILVEVAAGACGEIPGLISDPAPYARFVPGFGEGSLDFTLTCHVREFIDQEPVQHELRKRILRRFREEKIEFPEPIRTVSVTREKGKGSEPGRG